MNIRSFMRSLIAVGCLTAVLLTGCSTDMLVPTPTTEVTPTPTELPYTVENICGIDCYSIDGRVYAAELGAPILSKDAVIELYRAKDLDVAAEKITNIGDAFSYLKMKPKVINGPKEACRFFAGLISGDYNTVGFVEFAFRDDRNIGDKYCLLYVEQGGTYYAIDVYARGSDWITNPENDCFSSTDLNLLVEKLTAAFPFPGTINSVEVSGKVHMLNAGGIDYAPQLGVPVLGEEAVLALYEAGDINAAAEKITNIGDALYYLSKNPKQGPKEACNVVRTLIAGDYDAVGLIEMRYDKNYYCVMYVEYNGMYYSVDPFSIVTKETWITKPDCISNADLNVLAEKLEAASTHKGGELVSLNVSGDTSKPHGAKVFSYLGTTFPEGLGRPVLGDEEIDALIAEQDHVKTAETITTLADAVNYYRRAGIEFYEDHGLEQMNRVGEFLYVQSAWQVLKDNKGQCVTMSNLNHYLLQGDYDEVGYVSLSSPNDGHAMTYILEDGMYYLINSVDYTHAHSFGWLDSYPASLVGCAADFQEIADSIVNNMRLGDGELVNQVHVINSPGDHVFGMRGKKVLYPEGCTVTVYYGADATYGEPTLDWTSQTRIDY